MALLKSTWVLTAKLNEYETFMFHYDCINLIDALDQFWHSDYPEHLIDCENNGLFPIDVIAMPDEDGMVAVVTTGSRTTSSGTVHGATAY